MTSKPFLDAELIDRALVEECLKLYPVLVRSVYTESRPKSNLSDIIEDDVWRYEMLPKELNSKGSMTKAQLARLVKWKITHGVHRPFLPGMIQKNTDAEVQEHIGKAASLIMGVRHDQGAATIIAAIEAALKQVCYLKGVGPATGTLVLSVSQPKIVPFFEDELFFCLHPSHAGKLKYDKGEYKSLLTKALDIVLGKNIEAQALEKTAYVLMHSDKLSGNAKKQLKQCVEASGADFHAENDTAEPEKDVPKVDAGAGEKNFAGKNAKQARVRRKADVEDGDNASLRRSKRRKA